MIKLKEFDWQTTVWQILADWMAVRLANWQTDRLYKHAMASYGHANIHQPNIAGRPFFQNGLIDHKWLQNCKPKHKLKSDLRWRLERLIYFGISYILERKKHYFEVNEYDYEKLI